MPDKDQVFIFNNDELSLIKNTFAENDTLLYTLRKLFLQFPLTEVEKGLLKQAITPEVHAVLKKRMFPDPSPEFPLGQIPSILTTLTQDLKSKGVEDMALQFKAKQIEIDYLAQQFARLKELDRELPLISLHDLSVLTGKSPEEQFVDMTAYLFLLGYIDPSLNMMKVLAGDKNETPEEQKKRLRQDSTK